MQKYQNNVTNRDGSAAAGMSVVVNVSGGSPATIYSDNGLTVTANPMTTDVNGYFQFYAADGRYDIVVVGSGGYTDVLISDTVELGEDAARKSELAAAAGLPMLAFSADESQSIFDNALPMQNYTAIRAYSGRAIGIRSTTPKIAGAFYFDAADTTSADNGGTVLVGAGGRRWKRAFDGNASVLWFGAAGDGVTDDTDAIKRAITACRYVQFPEGRTYNVNITAGGSILVPSNTILDFCGSTVRDVGVPSAGCHIFKNLNHGASENANIIISGGTIWGCGSNGNTVDQGHGIALWKTRGVVISDMVIKNTAGDGVGSREAYDTTFRRLRIGNFGRNAISPTSGSYFWDDVVCDGVPFTGANPGAYIDAENNSSTETSLHRMNKVRARGITFVDFYDGAAFNHDVVMTNCEFGWDGFEAFNGIRLLNLSPSTPLKTAANFIIGSGVKVKASAGQCITLQNVAGVDIVGRPVLAGGVNGVVIKGACSNITIDAEFASSLSKPVFCFTAGVDTLSNSRINGVDGELYLRGSGNKISNSRITTLTLGDAATTGNDFSAGVTVNAVTLVNSAPPWAPPPIRSRSINIPDSAGGVTPYVMDITVPSGAASATGKVYHVLAGWTYQGRVLHFAQCHVVVGLGFNTNGVLATVSSTASAGHGIVVTCPDANTIRLTLTYSFAGTFSATVLG